jgi:hypothetical protein
MNACGDANNPADIVDNTIYDNDAADLGGGIAILGSPAVRVGESDEAIDVKLVLLMS